MLGTGNSSSSTAAAAAAAAAATAVADNLASAVNPAEELEQCCKLRIYIRTILFVSQVEAPGRSCDGLMLSFPKIFMKLYNVYGILVSVF